ncbi:MAG TPA: hypothetical protein DEG69_10495, partial [Flavobacteriaceae bacterium]|nr:hypothetical protein [Flavobacteriaceae bacterium]
MHGIPPETVKDRIVNGRSMFIYDRERNYFTSAIIGGTPAIAAGIALALKNKGSDRKVWCFVGDGTEDSGHLYEAIRYVDGWDLPCKFIIESNDRSVYASNSDRWGKTGDYEWNSPSVIKYQYDIAFPHCRTTDMIDLKKTNKKTDAEYFPPVPQESFHDLSYINSEDLSFKDAITKAMTELGDTGSYFIGYNVKYGDAMGNLKNVDDSQKIETPVAENLMSGLGIGMSFEGIKPVVFYER